MNLRQSFTKAKDSAKTGGLGDSSFSEMKLNTNVTGGYTRKKGTKTPAQPKSNMEKMLGI